LINEAHLLERKSEESARRGLFDDAVQNCIAACDCLSRILSPDDSSKSITNVEVRDSIRTQLAQLERRKNAMMEKKRQFEFLKNLLAQQQQLQQQRKEASEAEGEKLRRGSSASSLKRRSSTKESRRRSGVVETPSDSALTHRLEMNQQNARLASILDASPDSYSLLTTYLDGRANEPGCDINTDPAPIVSDDAASRKDIDPVEELRLQNTQLQQHVTSLLKKVEKERSRSAALEASLYELAITPRRYAEKKSDGHRLNLVPISSSVDVEDDEVTVPHPAELFRLNRLPLDLPPLDLPPIDISPSDLCNPPL